MPEYYLYLDRETVFHRLDPRTKISILFASFVASILFRHPAYVLAILLLVCFHAAAARSLSNVRRLWWLMLLIFLFSVPIWALYAGGQTRLWGKITTQSLQYGLANALRIQAMLVSGITFLSTTKNEEIALGLARLRVPFAVSFTLSTALRLVPTLVGTASRVVEAQQARGLDLKRGRLRERVRRHIPLLGPILLVTLRNANQLAMALEAKGFGARKDRSFLLDIRFSLVDWALMVLLLLLLLLAFLLRIQGKGQIPGLMA